MANVEAFRAAIREASRLAFSAVRAARPAEHFYYFALVTTGDGLRPGPSASSVEGLQRVQAECADQQRAFGIDELRWSEADSPYNLYGDEFFADVEAMFLEGGDHRNLPRQEYRREVELRYRAMEDALLDLDQEGFFGRGPERHAVVVNVVAPGEEDEVQILERATRLNPPESLLQLRRDLGLPGQR